MKEIAEKCPKGWKLYFEYWHSKYTCKHLGRSLHSHKENICTMNDRNFNEHFGVMVLEFFPSHGIEIERICMTYKSGICNNLKYRLYHKGKYVWFYHTHEEAIAKAFEILEKRLEEK